MFNPGSKFNSEAQSPPLHHPMPQHAMQSSPNFEETIKQTNTSRGFMPNNQQAQHAPQQGFFGSGSGSAPLNTFNAYGNTNQGTQASQGGSMGGSGFGGFQQYFNDPSAQIGLAVGRNALNYGQEYLGKNVSLIEEKLDLRIFYLTSMPLLL